jgi:hypothetical protein
LNWKESFVGSAVAPSFSSSFLPPNSPPTAGFQRIAPLPKRLPVAGFSSTGLIVVSPPKSGFESVLTSVLAPNKPPLDGGLNEKVGAGPNKP